MHEPTAESPFVDVDQIVWQDIHADGTRSATLAGTREPGVMFTYAFFIPAGVWDAPHSHGADVHLVVARGLLRLGLGPVMDRDAADGLAAGGFLHVPRGAVHFDGADEDTIIIGTATGPWTTTYA